MAFVLIAQSFPRILLVIPYFEMANRLGLKDTYLGLILAYSTFIQPLCLWIMKEYFEQIPRDLDEAAMVDGASPYRAFWDIILPLARPALGATAIIGFLTAWNEYEFALVLTSPREGADNLGGDRLAHRRVHYRVESGDGGRRHRDDAGSDRLPFSSRSN